MTYISIHMSERTKIMANRKRPNEFKLYFTDEELTLLNAKFKASGMRNKNAFIRHMIFTGFIYDIDYSDLREYNTQLGKIGGNINQIIKRLNATGNVYNDDVKEIKEMMEQVWLTQKSMLSKQPYIKQ